ncbi:fatty acid desaturase [Caballeronia sp. GAWG1-5s-s]|uniref:DesA family fatty acid desaturase n=1 Tax=Caballeronia sp. GAWG1-5s-s TaxID=2921743 RepID=UPI002027DEC0|nr:fatty acid desaturase [Caballeronia sp. GAWG1-5s-s]
MLGDLLLFLSSGLLALSWWQLFLGTIVMTHITIVSVTLYLHRCLAHRALDLHPAVRHFFRFWLWMTTGISGGSWAAVHRKHHAKCETADDPHSPQMRGVLKVVLEGAELYTAESLSEETLRRFSSGMPQDWLERNVYMRYPNLGVSLLMVIDVALFGVIGVSVWAVQMMWIPFWAGGVVNGFGHFLGYRNFDTDDASTNVIALGILLGGEELHNNHHAYPTSAKLSNKWYELDVGWMYTCILAAFKLATVRKVSLPARLIAGKRTVDDATLQAVLRHRHEVMASYLKSAEIVCVQALARDRHLRRREKHLLRCDVRELLRQQAPPAWGKPPQLPSFHGAWGDNSTLRTCIELRRELLVLWGHSSASREQSVKQLQVWCRAAEQSGIEAIGAFSLRLRQYAV